MINAQVRQLEDAFAVEVKGIRERVGTNSQHGRRFTLYTPLAYVAS